MFRFIILILLWLNMSFMFGQDVEIVESVTSSRVLDGACDLHISSSSEPISDGAVVNITSPDVFLYFDNIKPNDVVKTLKNKVHINGSNLNPRTNCRVVVYRHGSVVMAHSPQFRPLTTFTESGQKGASATYTYDIYYTNSPDSHAKPEMVRALSHDNKIRSFILKRGYSVTFANEPDGMGYSRVFIADDHDLVLNMPDQLDEKVSFIRVCQWQYPSKKGWAGSVWSSAPDGLQYVTEQCDYTNSTWFYNWGTSTHSTTNPQATDSAYNQEFVPEKWGSGDASSKLLSLCNASHLLGYNEPDHSEQSNVSVEKAIEEWPQLLRTGLRLGSPATTNFSWLYSFMSECRKKNYRVDYVVIHAYWGGLSGDEWYARLKEVHDKTGCPIWIKEWNNGANWTNEGWPSGTEAQQQKQLNDLKSILTVMDTCSFVERYSIYNWVQDKRAIILNGKLTPAGEYYASDQPSYFFNKDLEVVPVWRVRESPVLSYVGYESGVGAWFRWSDVNGEMIPLYELERSVDGVAYETVSSIAYSQELRASDDPPFPDVSSRTFYRLRSLPVDGSVKTSNVVFVNHLRNDLSEPGSDVYLQDIIINEQWSLAKYSRPFGSSFSEPPFVLLGTPTYRNKMPLTHRISAVTMETFDVQLSSWYYQENPQFVNPDTLGVLLFSERSKPSFARTMNVEVGGEWQYIGFEHPFATVPVVLSTIQEAHDSQPVSVRIRNVGTAGFEIKLVGEESTPCSGFHQVGLFIAEPGTYDEHGYHFVLGRTEENSVGSNLTGGYTVDLQDAGMNTGGQLPFFFSDMQTSNDELGAILRIKSRSQNSVTLIKDREKSVTHNDPSAETVGWMAVVKKFDADGVDGIISSETSPLSYYSLNGVKMAGSPLRNGIYIVIDTLGNARKMIVR